MTDLRSAVLELCDKWVSNDCPMTPMESAMRDVVVEKLRKLCAQYGWQPIESAPKDGGDILLWCGFRTVGMWVAKPPRGRPGWFLEPAGITPICMVTHWMPLPEMPK